MSEILKDFVNKNIVDFLKNFDIEKFELNPILPYFDE